MRIPLAAKCQLLFGAAVVLILAAALLVTWWRMESLTDQFTDSTAEELTRRALDDHVARQRLMAAGPAAPGRTTRPATLPTTAPATFSLPRFRLLSQITQTTLMQLEEQRAIRRFLRGDAPEFHRFFVTLGERKPVLRYVWALRAAPDCLACHAADVSAVSTTAVAVLPASRPAADRRPPLLGISTLELEASSPVVERQKLINRVFIFAAGGMAGALAIVVLYLIITGLILKPVRVLQETAERVGDGNLNVRAHVDSGDEFEQLAETLNGMLARLAASQEQLRNINAALQRKVVEMEQSNVKLDEANRIKGEFVASVSHELRTPLNSILGFAELMKDTPAAADPRCARYLQTIISSGKSLLGLINDLLDLARIDAGTIEIRSEPLSLSDLFEGLTSMIRPLADQRKLAVVAETAANVPIVHTDGARLQQVLFNFLSNAIKFSPEGGTIALRASRASDETVRISVTDQGPGIEPDKQPLIFQRFRQLDSSRQREHGGTGLGLAISAELTRLLGGTIGVESAPGQGATFWITLPIKLQHPAKAQEAAAAAS